MNKAQLFSTAIVNAMRQIEETFNQEIEWGGANYPCRVSAVTQEMRLVNAYVESVSRIVLLRKELFPINQPLAKDLIIYNGATYRVDSIEESEEAIKLILSEPNKRGK